MKTTGMVRKMEHGGRFVIPIEIRKQMNIESDGDSVEMYMEGDMLILKKYQPTCIFCDSLLDNVQMGNYTVCKSCIEKLNELKDEEDELV